jgi:spore photoproduct lyase
MKRHKPEGLTVAKNIGDILTTINTHAWFADVEKPNQTHKEFITYDISCNEDFALHAKYYDWQRIFQFFVDHDRALGTFATKIVPYQFLRFDPKGKVRIRFSLMPQRLADIVEPNTAKIKDRINAVNLFKDAGYDVHLNFSPVIIYDDWLEDYESLFKLVDEIVYDQYKPDVLAEVIFLTHNELKHELNKRNNTPGENLLWNPLLQEKKTSQYGGDNVRYSLKVKSSAINQWSRLHDKILPWNTIRYIF